MIRTKYIFIRNYKSKNLQVRPHLHDCYEFVYYYKASGVLRVCSPKTDSAVDDVNIHYLKRADFRPEQSFRFTDGCFAVLPPYTVHDEQHEVQASLICFGFYADEDDPALRASFHRDTGSAFLPYVKQIQNEYMNKYANYENMISALIVQIITMILRKENRQVNNDNEIAMIKNYIDEYFTMALPISKLASLSHYSEDHFCLKFKKAYNVSPKTYILNKRITLAKYLLTNTTLPLNEIALQCGYSDYVTFSQIFKQKVGVSPKKFQTSAL